MPLLDHALEALRLAASLPGGVADAGVLRQRAGVALSDFAARAARAGAAPDAVEAARFAVVALIDERAMAPGSPWRLEWLDRPLQLELCGCASAGEEFYRRLEAWRRPRDAAAAEVVEVHLACLALGFRGRLVGEAEAAERVQLMERLAGEVVETRRPPADGLVPQWRPPPPTPMARPPLRWWPSAVAAVLLAAVWVGGHALVAASAARAEGALR
jgi:type IV/VI secretion system ImpK/VasF family protein